MDRNGSPFLFSSVPLPVCESVWTYRGFKTRLLQKQWISMNLYDTQKTVSTSWQLGIFGSDSYRSTPPSNFNFSQSQSCGNHSLFPRTIVLLLSLSIFLNMHRITTSSFWQCPTNVHAISTLITLVVFDCVRIYERFQDGYHYRNSSFRQCPNLLTISRLIPLVVFDSARIYLRFQNWYHK